MMRFARKVKSMSSSRAENDAQRDSAAGQLVVGPETLGVSNTSNVTASPLSAGRYRVISDVSCHIRQVSSNTITVTASNAHRLGSDRLDFIDISGANDDHVAVYGGAEAGTLWLSKR